MSSAGAALNGAEGHQVAGVSVIEHGKIALAQFVVRLPRSIRDMDVEDDAMLRKESLLAFGGCAGNETRV